MMDEKVSKQLEEEKAHKRQKASGAATRTPPPCARLTPPTPRTVHPSQHSPPARSA